MGFKIPSIRSKQTGQQPPARGPVNQPAPAAPSASRPFPNNPDSFSVRFNTYDPSQRSVEGGVKSTGSVTATRTGSGMYRISRDFERPASTPEERNKYGFNGMVPHSEDWGEVDERDISHNSETGELSFFNRKQGNIKLNTLSGGVSMDNRLRSGKDVTEQFPSWMSHAAGGSGWSRAADRPNLLK